MAPKSSVLLTNVPLFLKSHYNVFCKFEKTTKILKKKKHSLSATYLKFFLWVSLLKRHLNDLFFGEKIWLPPLPHSLSLTYINFFESCPSKKTSGWSVLWTEDMASNFSLSGEELKSTSVTVWCSLIFYSTYFLYVDYGLYQSLLLGNF